MALRRLQMVASGSGIIAGVSLDLLGPAVTVVLCGLVSIGGCVVFGLGYSYLFGYVMFSCVWPLRDGHHKCNTPTDRWFKRAHARTHPSSHWSCIHHLEPEVGRKLHGPVWSGLLVTSLLGPSTRCCGTGSFQGLPFQLHALSKARLCAITHARGVSGRDHAPRAGHVRW